MPGAGLLLPGRTWQAFAKVSQAAGCCSHALCDSAVRGNCTPALHWFLAVSNLKEACAALLVHPCAQFRLLCRAS